METSKHTAGNWTFKPSGDANFYFIKTESKPNSWLMNIQQNGELSNAEQIANIELITEASSVANETGKTPRQLADENKELLDAFIELKKSMDETIKWQNGGLKHLSQAEQDRYKIICDIINKTSK
jgi:hypothetical protein